MSISKSSWSLKRGAVKPLVYGLLSFVALVQLFPLLWIISISFKTNEEIFSYSIFRLPESYSFVNYVEAWTKGHVQEYLLNSVVITAVSVIATLLLSSMIAYALARMVWRLRGVVSLLFLAGLMIPLHAILIPLFITLKRLGMLSGYLSLIIPYTCIGMPLGVFIFTNFMKSIPYELEAAAFIDGCSIPRAFFEIILPVVRPAFATVGIFTFLNNWNEFIMAATFLQNPRLRTLPLGLMAFQGEFSSQWGPMGAAILIASIPVILLYMSSSDLVERSFTAGAILK